MAKAQAKANQKILIVEDDSTQLPRYLEMAREANLDPFGARTEQEAMQILDSQSLQYVLTDIHLGGNRPFHGFEGMNILRHIRDNMPEVIPLAMTSDPKIQTYHDVLKMGAEYLFRKPIINKDELLIHLNAARSRRFMGSIARKHAADSPRREHLAKKFPHGVIISDRILEATRKIAAHGRVPVVIFGETGTGKEEVAKLIHRRRVENEGPLPFVAVNCATLQGDMAISALFGHKRGAFTGATETTSGFIGEANGGILFLDEVHTLSRECQQRLLRVLNDGTYSRVGEAKELHSDFQVIVASTIDLDDAIDIGNFLLDLRGRLTGIDLTLTPLRDRKDDLPALIELCFAKHGIFLESTQLMKIAEECGKYYWRGNIRQLFQVIQAWLVQSEGNEEAIKAENMPVFKHMLPPGDDSRSTQFLGVKGLPADAIRSIENALVHDAALQDTVGRFEKLVIQAAMARHDKLVDVAAALRIGRTTLDEKRRKYSI